MLSKLRWFDVGVAELDIDNFQLSRKGTFSGHQAYKNTKLCNVLFTYQLADSLVGTGVSVNSVNPGMSAAVARLLL